MAKSGLNRKPSPQTENAQRKLLKAMQAGKRFTHKEACEFICITVNSNNYRHMKRLYELGLVHIAEWQKHYSHLVPVFAIGSKSDAVKPPSATPLPELCRRTRERLISAVGREAFITVDRARRSGCDSLVVAGKKIWHRGHGIDKQAARAVFGN